RSRRPNSAAAPTEVPPPAVAWAGPSSTRTRIIVPAVLALLGKSAWWLPKWLDRVVPDVDVEGEKLNRALAADPGKGNASPDERQRVTV
ncbi:hypothetical protein ACWCQQ_49155, partial [Streptomyces sp. NPDC002143]